MLTKFMIFSPTANATDYADHPFDDINFSCGKINRVDAYEYLRLTVDSQPYLKSKAICCDHEPVEILPPHNVPTHDIL